MSINKNTMIVSIEGNIGSGKSTLLHILREKYKTSKKIIFLKEPVDEWELIKDKNGKTMIQKFYENQEKYSFPFQMMAYVSRLNLLKQAVKDNPECIIISERSLYTDKMVFAKMLYDSGKMEDVNYQIYCNWFNSFINNELMVDKVIYVSTDPSICHERIHTRSRAGENNIPLDYLRECHKYHNAMLDKTSSECVCNNQLVLNGNINIYSNTGHLDSILMDIDNFISS